MTRPLAVLAQQQSSGGGGLWGWLTSLFSSPATADQTSAFRTYYAGDAYFDANGNSTDISKLADAQIIQFNKDHRSEFAARGWVAAAIVGLPAGAVKLRGNQGYRDGDGNIWKKDQLIKIIGMFLAGNGNKIKEVDHEGNQIWPTVRRIRTSEEPALRSHPYREYEGTKLWKSIDKAITKLVKNGDMTEQTGRAYIVGYLTKSVQDSFV